MLYVAKNTSKRKCKGAVLDSKIQNVWYCSLSPVRRVYTITLLDHKALNICLLATNVWLHKEKSSTFLLQRPSFSCFQHNLNRCVFIAHSLALKLLRCYDTSIPSKPDTSLRQTSVRVWIPKVSIIERVNCNITQLACLLKSKVTSSYVDIFYITACMNGYY